jgi:hypothetical protein
MADARNSGQRRTVWRRRGRAKTIQLIHVGATRLGLIDRARPKTDPDHDSGYRDLLRQVTGCASAAECTDQQLDDVLAELKARGFVVQPTARKGRRPANMSSGDMRSKIEAQLTDMALSWTYAEGILRQQRGLPRGVACPVSGATARELRGIITALDVEQRKRRLLRDIDAKLTQAWQPREWLEDALGLRRGWERRTADLERASEWLQKRLGA